MTQLHFSFTEEPSLLTEHSRQRNTIISRNRSHAARHGHVQRKMVLLSFASKKRKRPKPHQYELHRIHRDFARALAGSPYENSDFDTVYKQLCNDHEGFLDQVQVHTIAHSFKSFPTSFHLASTYGCYDAPHINNLFDYFLHAYGPEIIWRIFSDEREQEMFRSEVLSFTLDQPAFLESLLALLHLHYGTLHGKSDPFLEFGARKHLLQALKLVRARITLEGRACDSGLMWTIMCIIVVNQEMGDWDACIANLNGLEALKHKYEVKWPIDGRASQFHRYLRAVRWQSCDEHPTSELNQQNSSNKSQIVVEQFQGCTGLSNDWSALSLTRYMDHKTLAQISCVINLANHHNGSHQGSELRSNLANLKTELVGQFLNIADSRFSLQDPAFLVALGVLCLISIRSPQGLNNEAIAAVRTYVCRTQLTNLPGYVFQDKCVVWAAYLISALPACYGLSVKKRLTLLHQAIFHRPSLKDWLVSSILLQQCYVDEALLRILKGNWRIAVAQYGLSEAASDVHESNMRARSDGM